MQFLYSDQILDTVGGIELVYLTSLLNSQGLMSNGPGAGP